MPIETLTVTVSSVIETNAAHDFKIDSSTGLYSDDNPSPTGLPPLEFWEAAIVNNPGDDEVRLFYDVGVGATVAAVVNPHTSTNLWALIGDNGLRDGLRMAYANPAFGGVWFAQIFEGEVMPAFVRITSSWSYSYSHHFGIDLDATLAPYVWRGADGLVEVSDWEAPIEPNVSDNDLYVGTVRSKGTNWDLGVPEVGVDILTIGIYQRVIDVGAITGQYLGSDRLFSTTGI